MADTLNFQVCYILTCDRESRYAAYTLLSIALLRRLYPGVHVVLLTDPASKKVLESSPTGLLQAVDECVQFATSDPDVTVRSRELKIRARELLQGDFLQLDSDTLPVRSFDAIFESSGDLSVALDRNHICPYPHFPRWYVGTFQQLGWSCPTPRYYNSGVIFWRDTQASREVSRLWLEAWQQQRRVAGIPFDQLSFNHAIDQLRPQVVELDIRYNALIRASPWFGEQASILHFHVDQFGDTLGGGDLLGALLQDWEKTGRVNWETVDRSLRSRYSWLTPPDHLSFLLRTGHYRRGLLLLLKKLFQAARKPAMLRDYLQDKLRRKNRAR
ncbi:MAG: hypothetical protein J0I12_33955 [Candidatus Eremiobacteraeota bacterium]|nr:hypothetical protein [Candidatus Eremiobacteraeota bacterium]